MHIINAQISNWWLLSDLFSPDEYSEVPHSSLRALPSPIANNPNYCIILVSREYNRYSEIPSCAHHFKHQLYQLLQGWFKIWGDCVCTCIVCVVCGEGEEQHYQL